MNAFDYGTEAALFSGKTSKGRQKALTYRRFAKAADAVRFAIEELSPQALDGCSLEVNDERYNGKEIRPLYESVDFPLLRRAKRSS
jgi:hypothetical protein